MRNIYDIAREEAMETVEKAKGVDSKLANNPEAIEKLTVAYRKLFISFMERFSAEMIADLKTGQPKPWVSSEFLRKYTEFITKR